jgi:transposase
MAGLVPAIHAGRLQNLCLVRVLPSAARWRDCPSAHGACTTVFNRWSRQGLWLAIGRSRGEQTSTLQGVTDGLGASRTLSISPGDIQMAAALLERLPSFERLIADRGYDANHLRALLAAKNVEAVIPFTRSRTAPVPYDAAACRIRNLVERMCGFA